MKRLLIVDDDADICESLKDIFSELGYEIVVCENGSQAEESVKEQYFHAALIDINLPEISGTDLLVKLKAILPDMVCFIITGNASMETAILALKAGATDYFVKPLVIQKLEKRLSEALNLQDIQKDLVESEERYRKKHDELRKTQEQVIQQEKLASIGQLAAGVAHEINNPIGFVTSNLHSLHKYAKRLTDLINKQDELLAGHQDEEKRKSAKQLRKDAKLDFIIEDISELIAESLSGTDRMKKIVQDLKSFSRVDDNITQECDINNCLESAVNIAWNELKYKTTVTKDLKPLPIISGYPQKLSQVFVNLLVNAAHAIEKKGEVIIKSWQQDRQIYVAISDTGCGIPPENIKQIFDPFFTTKEVGKGTGLGMSIASGIIEKHGGKISVQSEVGKGTTFTIGLPAKEAESLESGY